MQSAMDRLSGFISTRRWLVLGIWAVILVGSVPFAMRQTEKLTAGGFGVPGSGSTIVDDSIGAHFPGVQTEQLVIVFDNKKHDAAALKAAVDRAATKIKGIAHVALTPAARDAARSSTAPVVLMPLVVNGKADAAGDAAANLRKKLDPIGQQHEAVPVHIVGQQALWAALQDVSKEDLKKAETAGFPIVLIVLLAIFGSFAAAVLPLSLGFVSVIITGAVVFFLSHKLQMSIFVTNIASMLGIGVAVDYSLFVLARYREELTGGASEDDARATAMRTSGLAVAVSGVTVIVSLAGLFLINSTMMRSMAIGAIVVVLIAVLGAVTLLPAMIKVLGRRAYQRGRVIGWIGTQLRRVLPRRDRPAGGPSFWESWTAQLMRRPVVFALLATGLMLLIAVPAASLKWGNAALAQLPNTYETRVGFDQAASVVGPGALAPVQVIADFGGKPVDKAAVAAFAAAAAKVQGVARVLPAVMSKDGHLALVDVQPDSQSESARAVRVVTDLRNPTGPSAGLRKVATVSVGGAAAHNKDFSDLVSGSLWKLLLFVLIFSYLVLLVMLRSVVLPLKAVVMNLLSVAAAYGVLVIVFQYGWTDRLIGYHHLGYINAATPPLLLVIVFGLSMDYEVFLLSRIRERYHATGDNRTAVAQGLAASARTISSAAAIMVAVFLVFALAGLPQVKEIGVGLAVAVLLDATIVRLVLVPATMELMGHWNWWLPKSLDRMLPNVDFESDGHEPVDAKPGLLSK